MSALTSRHEAPANPVDVTPVPLSASEQALVWFAGLVACVLAFHLIALASGGAW